jgi:hypothetical protein
MFGFGRRKPQLTRAQQLTSKLRRMVEPEIVRLENGGAKLKVTVRPSRVHRLLLRFPESTVKSFELDSVGLFVWELCDGRTSVQTLISKVSRHLGITTREAEVCTLAFARTLVKKGLLGIEVPKPADERDAAVTSSASRKRGRGR